MVARNDEGRHPDPAVLESFLRGDLPSTEGMPVIAHLLRGCPSCSRTMEPTLLGMFRPGQAPPVADPAEYDEPILRAMTRARELAAETVREKPAAPAPRAPKARDRRASFESLLEASRAAQRHDPRGAMVLARLAAELAGRLGSEPGGAALSESEHADLQARAWAEIGNACRIAGELRESEHALGVAYARAAGGTGDPLLLGRIMDLTASLLTSQRRLREARELLDDVRGLYERNGEQHLAGRALISQGVSLGYANDFAGATRRIVEGLARIDPGADPALALSAVHGLLVFAVESGNFAQARTLLETSRPLYERQGGPLDRLKLSWLEARIAAGTGNPIATRAFGEVRARFEALQLPYEAAIVSLDLAALQLSQGRTAEVVGIVEATLATFRALEIRREAIAALLVLRRALERDRASAELLRAVSGRLRRFERGAAALFALEA